MCVVSMIMDHYQDEWGRRRPYYAPYDPFTNPSLPQAPLPPSQPVDLDKLRELMAPKPPAITDAEIEEFRRLLDRAREYDKRNNEPDCELDSKRQTLKTLAQELGVEISFL